MSEQALVRPRYGHLGKVLFVDLTDKTHRIETIDESVYRSYLGGYGLGAWLMWKHFPAKADALSPDACFAIPTLGPVRSLNLANAAGIVLFEALRQVGAFSRAALEGP